MCLIFCIYILMNLSLFSTLLLLSFSLHPYTIIVLILLLFYLLMFLLIFILISIVLEIQLVPLVSSVTLINYISDLVCFIFNIQCSLSFFVSVTINNSNPISWRSCSSFPYYSLIIPCCYLLPFTSTSHSLLFLV